MTTNAKAWLGRIGQFRRSDLATQAMVLLPVMTIAGLTAWTVLPGSNTARGQSVQAVSPVIFNAALQAAAPAEAIEPEAQQPVAPEVAVSPDSAAVDRLKISRQSWRRGGLGSRALVTFTLRNTNDYAVKDVEISCVFSRRDGSRLTDRKRVIADTINMKSRKTFARMHIGFVNINADRAKCTPVAASRV
jgi:hypothetical protein